MNSSYYELIDLKLSEARAMGVSVTEDALKVDLDDARTISVPLVWYPRLWHATPQERDNWEISGAGYGIHWPDLDEDISVKGLLIGNTSGESQKSLRRWLEGRKVQEGEAKPISLEGKTFWESVYELREKHRIPRVWKRAHLRPYLERPNGRSAPNAIMAIPSNQSITNDGKTRGDYVKKGQEPMAWRVGHTGSGEYRLICDPDDDIATQQTEMGKANALLG